MSKTLSLTLEGLGNLDEKLEEVAEAAAGASEALDKVESKTKGIADDMTTASKQAGNFKESLNDVAQSGQLASSAISKVERNSQDLAGKGSGLTVVLDDMSESQGGVAATSFIAADAMDQFEEQAQEARNATGGLTGALNTEALAALGMVGPNQIAADSIDKMGDEAAEARNKMAGAASMAELLSLKSSALSINVGAFTIALRNLTTQVPLLVTSLGNLVTAMLGVAGAIGIIGVGGLAGVLGGAVAEVESISGEFASMEERMQAVQAIGEEFLSMMREAIEPLVEMEGAVALFRNTLENLATTARVFSEAIAESYEQGPLKEAITAISDAWMDSITEITAAFDHMMEVVGVDFAESIGDAIRALDDFILFATTVVQDMQKIFGELTGDNTLNEFLTNLMAIGRQIAAGLAPILKTFLQVVGEVAQEIRALGSETIGAIVQVVALGLAVNRLASMLGNLIQPLTLAIGHMTAVQREAKSASSAFLNMSGRIVAGASKISSGFDSLSASLATAMPLMDPEENDLKKLARHLDKSDTPLSRMTGSIRELSSSLKSDFSGSISNANDSVRSFLGSIRRMPGTIKTVVTNTDGAFDDLSARYSAPQMDVSDLRASLGSATNITNSFGVSLDEMVGKEVFAQNQSTELAQEITSLGMSADFSRDEMFQLREELREMMEKGKLAEIQVDELGDELEELGFSSQVAEEGAEDISNKLTELSAKAGIIAGLSSVFTSLSIALAGLAAILASIVLAVGIAAAALIALGKSGQDAESIISGLKETLMNIARAVMPFVVASGNMVIDIFNSIMFVAKELVSGFEDLGVAMGLIDPSKADTGGMASSLENVLNSLIPVIQATGDFARMLAAVLAPVVAQTMALLVDLANALRIGRIINMVSETVQFLSLNFIDLGAIIEIMTGLIATLISGLIKVGAILGIATVAAIVATGGFSALSAAVGATVAGLSALVSPIVAAAAAIGVVIGAVVILLEKLGILDMILNAILGTIQLVIDGILGLAVAVGDVISSVIEKITDMWNNNIAGEISFSVPSIPGTDLGGGEISFNIPEIPGGGGGSDSESSDSSGSSGGPSDSDADEGDLFSGLDVVGGIGEAGKESVMGGPATQVEYNEGDTQQNFNQDISADPEDKAQMSRIAKDAMEEANSFARRRQGGQ